ncbi:MAG: ShlB/FhaC/HecB family hemolysin secretion/activation protein [Vulcanococcus sp.]
MPASQPSSEQRTPAPAPRLSPDPGLITPPTGTPTAPGANLPEAQSWRPPVRGQTPYSPSDLIKILQPCGRSTTPDTLQACAATLTARLVKDGYVNSRVFTLASPAPGVLEVVEGRLVELRVRSTDPALAQEISKRLKPLIGSVLHLPSLENSLVRIRAIPGVGQISGNLGRLGSDPTQAVLNLSVDSVPVPWRGDLALRNDGNGGTGQWRNTATVLKNNLFSRNDTFLTYLELNSDSDPELGGVIGSISYSWPLSDRWQLTSSVGYSRRNLVELSGLAHELSFRQFQALAQVETALYRSPRQQWSAFVGISGNRNDSYLAGDSFPLIAGGGADGWLTSGYLRAGVNGAARLGLVNLSGNLYALQGIAGFSTSTQLSELASFGIRPGQARAVGGLLNAAWSLRPDLTINLRGAGQLALNKLTNDMGFSIGSDVGLRGLPGSLISGDNGSLGSGELVWTVWRGRSQALQLVPFLGVGWVQTTLNGIRFSDTIGSGGLLLRWLAGRHWAMELGWVDQFSDGNNSGFWNDWLLGNGIYSKVQFRF